MSFSASTIPGFVHLESLRDPRAWEPSTPGKVKAIHRGLAKLDKAWLDNLHGHNRGRPSHTIGSDLVHVEYIRWEQPDERALQGHSKHRQLQRDLSIQGCPFVDPDVFCWSPIDDHAEWMFRRVHRDNDGTLSTKVTSLRGHYESIKDENEVRVSQQRLMSLLLGLAELLKDVHDRGLTLTFYRPEWFGVRDCSGPQIFLYTLAYLKYRPSYSTGRVTNELSGLNGTSTSTEAQRSATPASDSVPPSSTSRKASLPISSQTQSSTIASLAVPTDILLRNLSYVAPEHISNAGADPVTADIYTWASCVYHLLLEDSDPEFTSLEAAIGPSRQEQGQVLERIHRQSTQTAVPLSRLLGPQIPDATSQIVAKAMSTEPDRRYITSDTLLADLVDLERLLSDTINMLDLERFELGRVDRMARCIPSPNLIAREEQWNVLTAAHARLIEAGQSETIWSLLAQW